MDFKKWYDNIKKAEKEIKVFTAAIIGTEQELSDDKGKQTYWLIAPYWLNTKFIDDYFNSYSNTIIGVALKLDIDSLSMEHFVITDTSFKTEGYFEVPIKRNGVASYVRMWYDRKACIQQLLYHKSVQLERLSREVAIFAHELSTYK